MIDSFRLPEGVTLEVDQNTRTKRINGVEIPWSTVIPEDQLTTPGKTALWFRAMFPHAFNKES